MTREGAIFPLPFFAIAIVFFMLFRSYMALPWLYASALTFYVGLAIMLFFRDPDRKIPKGEKLLLAPADGKIIRLENNGKAEISIFLSVLNVHVNRSPVDGVIKSVTFHQGKFLAAFKPGAMTDNQRNEIEIETDNGIVRMHQVTGAIARRTICNKKPGDKVKAGERIGLIRFGSRVDLFLPESVKLDIKMNQKVVAGETKLGSLA
jgi:phosphatidylserine decarboxylase